MTSRTGFFWDERTLWHSGGNYALTLPVGGLVQPPAGGGLPENPETKRRLVNLLRVTGLADQLSMQTAAPATRDDLLRVHPAAYLDRFKAKSDAGGGELGLRTPFGQGAYEIAAMSAGLATAAVTAVLTGTLDTAYALSRPPGHHCLPDWPNGFCLLNNIAIAVEAVRTQGLARRVAVLDWDVHHGNGTEAIFYEDPDVLTISLHQERNYPLDTGDASDRGRGAGLGLNLNVPLPPGGGHDCYLHAMRDHALPAIAAFGPEIIIVACGFDASGVDPLSRMLARSETFRIMTAETLALARTVCDGRLVLVHEGGYSEVHVPFCGHAVLEVLKQTDDRIDDPLDPRIAAQQPDPALVSAHRKYVDNRLAAGNS